MYQSMKNRFKELGATLLVSEEEYNKNNVKVNDKVKILCECGHERLVTYNDFRRGSSYLCTLCNKNKNKKRTTYEEMCEKVKQQGCVLLTSKEDYDGENMTTNSHLLVKCRCDHERTINFTKLAIHPTKLCLDCQKNLPSDHPLKQPFEVEKTDSNKVRVSRNIFKKNTSYENLCEQFKKLGCEVITTETELEELVKENPKKTIGTLKVKIRAQCGHLRETAYYTFEEGSNYDCLDCGKKKVRSERQVSYDEYIERFNLLGLKVISSFEAYNNHVGSPNTFKFDFLARCGHQKCSTYNNISDLNPNQILCDACIKPVVSKKLSVAFRRKYEDVVKELQELGAELAMTKEEYDTQYTIGGDNKIKILATCGHETVTRFHDFKTSMFLCCYDCARKLKDNGNLTYDEIYGRFDEVGCKLLTSKDEFVKNRMTVRSCFKFHATCGHEREGILGNITLAPGMLCKHCSRLDFIKQSVERAKRDGLPTGCVIEYESICYIKDQLDDLFDVEILCEGCKADLAVRPKDVEADEWMGIQLKATEKKNNKNAYSFATKCKYDDLVVFCICPKENKLWYIPTDMLENRTNVTVVEKEGTLFNKCFVPNVVNQVHDLYNTKKKHKLSVLDTPQSETSKQEKVFRMLRETRLSSLQFEKPYMNYLVYDFKVNGFRVQEKVVSDDNHVSLHKANGKNQKQPYAKGDNDFYWLHKKNKNTFYVIPEVVLIEHKYISNELQEGNRYLNVKYANWIKDYKFKYDDLDIKKLESMFGI